MLENKKLLQSISESGLTGTDWDSLMRNELEVTKENNRSAEVINAQEMQDKKEKRYHWLCIIAFVGVFAICIGLLFLTYKMPSLDSKIIPTISTLVGTVFGFVAGKKI